MSKHYKKITRPIVKDKTTKLDKVIHFLKNNIFYVFGVLLFGGTTILFNFTEGSANFFNRLFPKPPYNPRELIKLSKEDSLQFAGFLTPSDNLGAFKILQKPTDKDVGTYGFYFSFNKEIAYGTSDESDIALENDKLITALSGNSNGYFMKVGKENIKQINFNNLEWLPEDKKEAWNYMSMPFPILHDQYDSLQLKLEGIKGLHTKKIKLENNSSYLVRSTILNKRDVLVAFHVERNLEADTNGVFITWQIVKKFPIPILQDRIYFDIKGFEKNDLLIKTIESLNPNMTYLINSNNTFRIDYDHNFSEGDETSCVFKGNGIIMIYKNGTVCTKTNYKVDDVVRNVLIDVSCSLAEEALDEQLNQIISRPEVKKVIAKKIVEACL